MKQATRKHHLWKILHLQSSAFNSNWNGKAADRSSQATKRPQINFINLRSPFGLTFFLHYYVINNILTLGPFDANMPMFSKLNLNTLPDSTQLKISIFHHIQHEQTLTWRLRKTCKQKEFLHKDETLFLTSLQLPRRPCLISLTHSPSVAVRVAIASAWASNFSRFQRDPKFILNEFNR